MPPYLPVTDMLDTPPDGVDPDELAAMPAALARRPWHPRLHVPVPAMNVHTDENHPHPFVDFLGVDPKVSVRCLHDRLCGVCGTEIGEELALLGTLESAAVHLFADPHMHENCARSALRWCPHLRLHNHKRAPDHRRHPDTPDLAEWDAITRPDRWVLAITDTVTLALVNDLVLYHTVGYRRVSMFAYVGPNNELVEYTANQPI
jgi:hypothetical protein